MKKVFLLIVVPALLVAMGFAQTPAASSNADQINVKGCLGGTDGNYTVAEDNTGKTFKIATSSADLKAYVGQEVKLIGHKAGTAENSFAVTEVNMVSEHCTAAAAVPAASVSAPAETISTPPAAAAAPAAPAETVSTPPAAATAPAVAAPAVAAPAETVSTPPETVSAPPAAAAAPAATVSTPAKTASELSATAAVHRARPSAQHLKPVATPAAAAEPAEPVSKPVAHEVVPVAPVGPAAETASTPAAAAPAATKASTSRSTLMLGSIVVVVVLIGFMVPLFQRWRRRKLLEETSGQNLSFTKEAKSDPGKTDTTGGRKAA